MAFICPKDKAIVEKYKEGIYKCPVCGEYFTKDELLGNESEVNFSDREKFNNDIDSVIRKINDELDFDSTEIRIDAWLKITTDKFLKAKLLFFKLLCELKMTYSIENNDIFVVDNIYNNDFETFTNNDTYKQLRSLLNNSDDNEFSQMSLMLDRFVELVKSFYEFSLNYCDVLKEMDKINKLKILVCTDSEPLMNDILNKNFDGMVKAYFINENIKDFIDYNDMLFADLVVYYVEDENYENKVQLLIKRNLLHCNDTDQKIFIVKSRGLKNILIPENDNLFVYEEDKIYKAIEACTKTNLVDKSKMYVELKSSFIELNYKLNQDIQLDEFPTIRSLFNKFKDDCDIYKDLFEEEFMMESEIKQLSMMIENKLAKIEKEYSSKKFLLNADWKVDFNDLLEKEKVTKNDLVRLSLGMLFRIQISNTYFLPYSARQNLFTPFGKAYELNDDLYLKLQELYGVCFDRKFNSSGRNEFKMLIPADKFLKFTLYVEKNFNKKMANEKCREYFLASISYKGIDDISLEYLTKHAKFSFLGRHYDGVNFSRIDNNRYNMLMMDIIDVELDDELKEKFIDYAKDSTRFGLFSEEMLLNQGVDPLRGCSEKLIAPHAYKLTEIYEKDLVKID